MSRTAIGQRTRISQESPLAATRRLAGSMPSIPALVGVEAGEHEANDDDVPPGLAGNSIAAGPSDATRTSTDEARVRRIGVD